MRYTIRKSANGNKLHLSGGPTSAVCSAGTRGIALAGRIKSSQSAGFPPESFCKKCFGLDPYKFISHLIKKGYLE